MSEYEDLSTFYPDHLEELEERAAIMEYDGGYSRKTAERFAAIRLKRKYGLYRQGELKL